MSLQGVGQDGFFLSILILKFFSGLVLLLCPRNYFSVDYTAEECLASYNGHSRYVQTKHKYDYYSNSSFSLTLEWPTSGENLPKAFRRTELTFKVPGIGVDDLCNSQGFFGFRREV